MNYQFQSICDQGAFRSNNEDAIKFGVELNGELVWMVVADGMGGHLAGEVASNLFVDEIEAAIQKIEDTTDVDWLCWLEIEINRANNKIYLSSQKNTEQKGMGTTGVIVIYYRSRAYIGWVGDSRCYVYQKDNKEQILSQLTTDHTMIQALLDKGAITEKEAENANNKNMLSKAIGVKKGVAVETKSVPIHTRAVLLLSTDGLHDSLSDKQLLSSVKDISNGIEVTKDLVKLSIKNGSKDNITLGSILIS